jgi:cell division protein FtsX
MKEELTGADYLYSVKIGSLLGFFAGWLLGITLLLYLDSKALNNWPGVPSIPLWNGIGWAIYGFIVGGSGLFAHVGRKTAKPETTTLKPAA